MGDPPLCILHFPGICRGTLKDIVGTDKAERDAEAKKEPRRKAKSKGKKPKPQDDG